MNSKFVFSLSYKLVLAVFIVSLLVLLLAPSSVKGALQPCVEWSKGFSGEGRSVQQTNDGGYIVAGTGNSDILLIRTTSEGDEVWNRAYGGSGNDEGYDGKQTTDGGYIVVGCTRSQGAGAEDAWLIKTDSNGDVVWDETFGTPNNEWGHSVQQTNDGGYIIAVLRAWIVSIGGGVEALFGDVWLIKVDSNGNMLWDRTFDHADLDRPYSVKQTSDGGYIIAGEAGHGRSHGSDIWLIRTDSNGNMLWDKTFDYSPNSDVGRSVLQTNDGGYAIAGLASGVGGILIKTDPSGNEVWNRTYGRFLFSVNHAADGGYIVTGEAGSSVYIMRTDSNGNEIWSLTPRSGRGYSVQQTSDNGYIVTGRGGSVCLIKLGMSNPPNQPTNTEPADDAANVSIMPTLGSSAFVDADVGDTHAASQWQIRTSTGSYSSPVYDSGADAINLNSITISPGTLSYSTTYYWHVRQQDNHGAWSIWSAETSYTTISIDLYWLSKCIMSEASVGTAEEQVAVGWTVLNRLDSGRYGDDIENVVKSGYAYNQEPTVGIIVLAKEVLERNINDPTAGATYLFSPRSMPKEGESTEGYDVGGWLHEVPGVSERVYFPSWTSTFTWVGDLDNVRRAYFMFYTELEGPNTPLGPKIPVDLSEAFLTFKSVAAGGTTTVTTSQGNPGDELPSGFRVKGQFIDITTSATYVGPVEVCIPYDPGTPKPENLKLFHWEDGHWQDVTTHVDTDNNLVCGEVVALSAFFVGEEEGEGCFIATAAYGTSTAGELNVLRAFRDEVLLQNSLSSQLVAFYYEVSPPVAEFISEHDVLRTLVRELLVDPVAWVVDAIGSLWRD